MSGGSATFTLDITVTGSARRELIMQIAQSLDEAELKLLLAELGSRVGAEVSIGDEDENLFFRVITGIRKLPGDQPAEQEQVEREPVEPLPVRPKRMSELQPVT